VLWHGDCDNHRHDDDHTKWRRILHLHGQRNAKLSRPWLRHAWQPGDTRLSDPGKYYELGCTTWGAVRRSEDYRRNGRLAEPRDPPT
jgi:hypothetical protein